ncbi:ribbon-helix-helix domain-containing protein [Methylobacterium sp. D53M]
MAKKPASVFAPQPDEDVEGSHAPAPVAVPRSRRAAGEKPPYKVGMRTITAIVPEAAQRQFKVMAAEQGKTVQDYMSEILNREFARHGRPQIA